MGYFNNTKNKKHTQKHHLNMLIIYGDTISDININDIFNYHIKINKPIVAVKPLQLSFGIFDIDNQCIINYDETNLENG